MRRVRPKKHKSTREALFDGIGVPEPKPFIPDDFQLRAIEALKQGKDTLVIAPTGTGKTYIAAKGIEEVAKAGKRAIYTAPLKALSNSKYSDFKKQFEPEIKVGLLTGDRKIDTEASIVIATTEIYRNDLFSMRGDYSLVVLDELHYLSDPQRGPVWEESIILSSKDSVLLMLSASISNAEEIAEWINSVRGKPIEIIKEKERQVKLRYGFIHPRIGILPMMNSENKESEELEKFYSFKGNSRVPGRRGRRS